MTLWGRNRLLIAIGSGFLALVAASAWLAFDRYVPALDEARSLRADVLAVANQAQAAGLDIDRPQLDDLEQDVAAARNRLEHLADLLDRDPLIGLARMIPPTGADVRGADAIVEAGRQLFEAAGHGLTIANRFVEIKESSASRTPDDSTLARMVELMATSHQAALASQSSLARAQATLEAVPVGLIGPVESARAAMVARLDAYVPLLDAYVLASARLPSVLGWDVPRRYLVLTQNSAELRPTGGFIGSYGIIVFDRGRMVEHNFRDVYLLDLAKSHPFIEPPADLVDHVLGPGRSWQLVDANWSPDFPTSAQDAVRLYTNESKDPRIDGVVGISTHTIDDVLQITGPVTVPEYRATISPGETTLKALQLTRAGRPGQNRKAFLSAFADRLVTELLTLPSSKWSEIIRHIETFKTQRLLLAWFKDPEDQSMVARGGFDGSVRQDPGDYVYPVDSNVVPASKISAIARRTLHLDVRLDEQGNATNTLDVSWDNPIDTPEGKPYRELPTLENLRNLGMYFRLLVPEGSRVESVSGDMVDTATEPAVIGLEASRSVIGTYLVVPPGNASLRYVWTSPNVSETNSTGSRYHLTIQKQPGLLPGPLIVTVHVPLGSRIQSGSPGMTMGDQTAAFTTTFDEDVELDLRYVMADVTNP